MSITLKSPREIDLMRKAGVIVGNTLQELREVIRPGMSTEEVDRLAEMSIRRQGGEPAFPYIDNFPGSVCISVNEEVVHGIPGKRILRDGDLVKIDAGAIYQGYHGDAAITAAVGRMSPEARQLMQVTEEALVVGIKTAQPNAFVHDIGAAIEDYVGPYGYGIVRPYVGHGVGRELHEEPNVPHFRQTTKGARLRPGMTLTIEPMINLGTPETVTRRDGWTVVTRDKKLSAQFEHTILVTEDGPEVLTMPAVGVGWAETATIALSAASFRPARDVSGAGSGEQKRRT
ncbi:MAG: type I methionyl aminopeptidase [Chloroflexota bacterium]